VGNVLVVGEGGQLVRDGAAWLWANRSAREQLSLADTFPNPLPVCKEAQPAVTQRSLPAHLSPELEGVQPVPCARVFEGGRAWHSWVKRVCDVG